MILKRIGYIAAIEYNSEGSLIEWTYGKKGLTDYCEKCHILKTEAGAKRHLDKFAPHNGRPYVREYYRQID